MTLLSLNASGVFLKHCFQKPRQNSGSGFRSNVEEKEMTRDKESAISQDDKSELLYIGSTHIHSTNINSTKNFIRKTNNK